MTDSRLAWSALLALAALPACMTVRAPTHPELATVAAQKNALALADALEKLIASGHDTPTDRAYALQAVREMPADTAEDAFGRATITGRVVQGKGLRAANLVPQIEFYAQRSRELDPNFRGGAATTLLGTLYVIAPATLLKNGDSETGLELLEENTNAHPEVAENHLRLAEAYITLHDPEPAGPHICFCLEHQSELRAEDQRLLKGLLDDAAPLPCDLPADAQ